MHDQKELIKELLSKSHFTLIVLDACRFDLFKSEFRNFLDGELSKVWSPANTTPEWISKCLPRFYDMTVISANPYLNSIRRRSFGDHYYNARKHFTKIVDVWDWGWDDKLSAVPPSEVNKAYRLHKSKRTLVWYIQPHGPWIGDTKIPIPEIMKRKRKPVDRTLQSLIKKISIRKQVPLFLRYRFNELWSRIFRPKSFIAENIEKGKLDIETLRKAYKDNLRLVLKCVSNLPTRGRTIVTSDHGELLGENGKYLHSKHVNHSKLREVPWLLLKD